MGSCYQPLYLILLLSLTQHKESFLFVDKKSLGSSTLTTPPFHSPIYPAVNSYSPLKTPLTYQVLTPLCSPFLQLTSHPSHGDFFLLFSLLTFFFLGIYLVLGSHGLGLGNTLPRKLSQQSPYITMGTVRQDTGLRAYLARRPDPCCRLYTRLYA